ALRLQRCEAVDQQVEALLEHVFDQRALGAGAGIEQLPQKQGKGAGVLEHVLQVLQAEVFQQLRQRPVIGGQLQQQRLETLGAAREHRLVQRQLAGEMMEDIGLADAGSVGDETRRDTIEAALAEQALGSGEDAFYRFGCGGLWRLRFHGSGTASTGTTDRSVSGWECYWIFVAARNTTVAATGTCTLAAGISARPYTDRMTR